MTHVSCIELFCGAGGLTHGFTLEGIPVVAGIDLVPACRFPYETNNTAKFLERDISQVTAEEINKLFGNSELKIPRGLCALPTVFYLRSALRIGWNRRQMGASLSICSSGKGNRS